MKNGKGHRSRTGRGFQGHLQFILKRIEELMLSARPYDLEQVQTRHEVQEAEAAEAKAPTARAGAEAAGLEGLERTPDDEEELCMENFFHGVSLPYMKI